MPEIDYASFAAVVQGFHPHGQHPATARAREQLARLLDIGLSEDHRYVRWLREQMAEFEEGESIRKADYLRRLER